MKRQKYMGERGVGFGGVEGFGKGDGEPLG